MKTLLPLCFLFALFGCSKGDATLATQLADRTYTVDEFLAQPDLRKKISTACGNDPGRLALEASCINVRRADHIASAGSLSNMPRVVP